MRLYWKILAGVFFLVLLTGANGFAQLDLHGQVFYDSYIYHQDAEGFARPSPSYTSYLTTPGSGGLAGVPVGTAPAAADRDQTYFDLNHATSIRAHWRNKEGLGAFYAMYMTGDPSQSLNTGGGGFNVGVSVALLYWDINPNLRIVAGKGGTTQVFTPLDPKRYMGYDGISHVTMLGYGNINSKYQNNLRFTYKFNQNFKLDVAFLNPRLSMDNESYLAFGPGFTAKTGTAVDNVSMVPKVEIAVPMTFQGKWGNFMFTPSAMYLKSKFENVQDGHDDSITSYGLSASTKFKLFDFEMMAEYNFGQNLANAARTGESQCTPFKMEYVYGGLWKGMAARSYNGTVYDGKTHSFWVSAGYTIAKKVTPTIFYGRNDSERDMPGASMDCDTTTQCYGITIPIKVTRNLSIVPEYTVWDNGDNNQVDGTYYDFGKESIMGIQMRLMF